MGFIPIILVLLLVVLLWVILNYNSFLAKKAAVELLYIKQEKLARQRAAEVIELNNFLKTKGRLFAEEMVGLLKNQGSSLTEQINFVKLKVKTDTDFSEEPSFTKIIEKVESKELDFQKIYRKYLSALVDYNKLVREKPSSYIAILFGFKVFN